MSHPYASELCSLRARPLAGSHCVYRGGQREVEPRETARRVRRKGDTQATVGVQKDVRMMVGALGLLRDPVDERNRRGEVLAIDIGDQRVALASPGRIKRGEAGLDLLV